MKPAYADVTETLLFGAGDSRPSLANARAMDDCGAIPSCGVFELADADIDPLPDPARVALEWDGMRWAEMHPRTGELLAIGEVALA